MENYKVALLRSAEIDLNGILSDKAKLYPNTRSRFISAMRKCFETMARAPLGYVEYEHDKRYRKAVVAGYLVFYMVNSKSKTVRVYRILHGKMDIEAHL